ncbi:MAG: GNAT family N-acetyltransferase [Proteobacteria bacterium]|nr:MAG: GNAT family N-acetyltransferase [Pseudomonadota bacterium]
MLHTSKVVCEELPLVNDLIKKSKQHWYPEDGYVEAAMKFIRIDSEWVSENEGLCLYEDKQLVGFLGYSKYEDYWYLEHLWIDPQKIGHQYGTKALNLLKKMATDSGIHKISLLPEPMAEGFYETNGAQFTGLDVPSCCPGGPVFKEMVFIL